MINDLNDDDFVLSVGYSSLFTYMEEDDMQIGMTYTFEKGRNNLDVIKDEVLGELGMCLKNDFTENDMKSYKPIKFCMKQCGKNIKSFYGYSIPAKNIVDFDTNIADKYKCNNNDEKNLIKSKKGAIIIHGKRKRLLDLITQNNREKEHYYDEDDISWYSLINVKDFKNLVKSIGYSKSRMR